MKIVLFFTIFISKFIQSSRAKSNTKIKITFKNSIILLHKKFLRRIKKTCPVLIKCLINLEIIGIYIKIELHIWKS